MSAVSQFLGLVLLTAAAIAWSKDPEPTSQSAVWVKGRSVYIANCAGCHNRDPAKDGPLGPALKGSSRELLEYRVLRRAYPPGYLPKRSTNVMPSFPSLHTEVSNLAAYLR